MRWLSLLLMLYFISGNAQENAPYQYVLSAKEKRNVVKLVYQSYTVLYDTLLKMPREITYVVTRSSQKGASRDRYYKKAPQIDSIHTLVKEDWDSAYAKYGYQKGHLAPLGSLDSADRYYELNYFVNIAPQSRNLNQGPWQLLEEKVRVLAQELDSIWVTTGTKFEGFQKRLPHCQKDHEVPSHFYKVLVFWENGKKVVYSFLMDQNSRSKNIYDYATTYEELME